jgi:hypothetical protein
MVSGSRPLRLVVRKVGISFSPRYKRLPDKKNWDAMGVMLSLAGLEVVRNLIGD